MLIEILVSALVLTIASAGVVVLLQSTTKTQAELRHNTEAYALAQEDQARLASMRLSTLNRLDQTRTVGLNKVNFSVRSKGVFINDNTSTPSCGEGTSSADYVEITSIVTWPGMDPGERARIVSILSPSNGSLDPNNGTLAISVKTPAQVGVPNVYASGGSGAFAGYTDAAGCAVFTDLPGGNYTATISGEAAKVVNKDGLYSEKKTVPVVGGDAKTVTFEFDRPATIPVTFKYRGSDGLLKIGTADSVIAYNSGMTAAKAFATADGLRSTTVNATPLFPFGSSYYMYAGTCASNNPDPKSEGINAAAVANVVAPAGGTTAPAVIQLPTLELIVKKSGGLPLQGATVTITETACKDSQGNYLKRTYTSNASGLPSNSSTGIAELGLPFGTYDLCASANISGTVRREKVSAVAVKSLTTNAVKPIELTTGDTSGSC